MHESWVESLYFNCRTDQKDWNTGIDVLNVSPTQFRSNISQTLHLSIRYYPWSNLKFFPYLHNLAANVTLQVSRIITHFRDPSYCHVISPTITVVIRLQEALPYW